MLNPYLRFDGDAREAMEFYRDVFGGELNTSTFGEFAASDDPAEAEKIMHSMLTTDAGLVLMASDTPRGMPFRPGSTISVSLSGGEDSESDLRGYWDTLVEGGTVTMPLAAAPWGDSFGSCVDRFGIEWLVNIAGAGSVSDPATEVVSDAPAPGAPSSDADGGADARP